MWDEKDEKVMKKKLIEREFNNVWDIYLFYWTFFILYSQIFHLYDSGQQYGEKQAVPGENKVLTK